MPGGLLLPFPFPVPPSPTGRRIPPPPPTPAPQHCWAMATPQPGIVVRATYHPLPPDSTWQDFPIMDILYRLRRVCGNDLAVRVIVAG